MAGGSNASAPSAFRSQTTYLEYPPSIGQSLKHWVTFEAFDFRDHKQTICIDL